MRGLKIPATGNRACLPWAYPLTSLLLVSELNPFDVGLAYASGVDERLQPAVYWSRKGRENDGLTVQYFLQTETKNKGSILENEQCG